MPETSEHVADLRECPSHDILEAISGDDSGVSVPASVRQHVAECQTCQEEVSDIRHNNAFLARAAALWRDRRSDLGDPASAVELRDYEIIEEMQRGGQGVVYKALQTATKRTVAIKMLLHGVVATTRQRHRFEREIEIAASLRHPGIVAVYGAATLGDGRAALVMEYVEGEPFDRRLARDAAPAADVVRSDGAAIVRRALDVRVAACLSIFEKICEAVAYAHQRGVIHRDLKPANILVDEKGLPHILDFGLAKLTGAEQRSQPTRTGEFMGTIAYAAPEQVRGSPNDIDVRTDVYALGVVLYEALAGRLPHPADGALLDVVRHIAEVDPPRVSDVRRGVDDELEAIVRKALAKAPHRRYESAGSLLADLRRYLANQPIEAKRDHTGYVVWKAAQRHRWPLAAAVLFVAVAVGFGINAYRDAKRIARERDAAATQSRIAMDERDRAVRARREADEARAAEQEQRRAAEANARQVKLEADKAQSVSRFLQEMLSSVDPREMGKDVTVRAALDAAAQRIDRGEMAEHPDIEAGVRQAIGTAYAGLALYPEAERHLRRALDALRNGPDASPITQAAMLNELAAVLFEEARYEDSETVVHEVLDMEEALRAAGVEGIRQICRARSNLSCILRERGATAEAEMHLREVLALQRSLPDDGSDDMVTTLGNLASLLRIPEQAEEAERLYREAIDIMRGLVGDDHLDLAGMQTNYALLLLETGRMDEAEKIMRDALAIRRKQLGVHPEVAQSLNNLGSLMREKGDLAEAERLYEESLEVVKQIQEPDHPNVALAMANLATVRVMRRDFEGAEKLARDALAAQRARLGERNETVAQTCNNLGSMLFMARKYAAAADAFREALALRRELVGPQHRLVTATQYNLGMVLKALDQFEEAKAVFEEALASRQAELGPRHPLVATTAIQVADCERSLGDHEAAGRRLQEVLDWLPTAAPSANLLLVDTMVGRGLALLEGGSAADAEAVLRPAVDLSERCGEPGRLADGWARHVLGACLAAQKRFDEAEDLLLQGFDAMASDPQVSAMRCRAAADRICRMYTAWGLPEQADEWQHKSREFEPVSAR